MTEERKVTQPSGLGLTAGRQTDAGGAGRITISQDAIIDMTASVCRQIKRKMSDLEIRAFVSFARSLQAKDWSRVPRDRIRDTIVSMFIQDKFTQKSATESKTQAEPLDIREVLKLQIGAADSDESEDFTQVNADGIPISRLKLGRGKPDPELGSLGTLGSLDAVTSVKSIGTVQNIEKIAGYGSVAAIQSVFNPAASYKQNYIILDTRYRSNDTDGTTEFSWTFLNNSTAGGPGVVNSIGNVKNIVALRVDPIRIPYNDLAFISAYKRVSMFIREFSTQAVIGQEGRRYHFLFKTEADGNQVDLIPVAGLDKGIFKFAKPITQLDKLTVSFSNPLEPLIFPKDRMNATVSYTNPARFVTTEDHNLETADQVYFSGFTTGDPVVDKDAIAAINSTYGLNIFVIDATTFDVEVDLSAVTPIVGQQVAVYFGSKRILISMEITYIDTTDRRTAE